MADMLRLSERIPPPDLALGGTRTEVGRLSLNEGVLLVASRAMQGHGGRMLDQAY